MHKPLWISLLVLGLVACSSGSNDANPGGGDASVDTSSSGDVSLGADVADSGPETTGLACDVRSLRKQYLAGASTFDLDCDGKTDWRLERGADGTIAKETVDLNEDGKPDMRWDYTSTPILFESDDDLDGRIDHRSERSPGSTAGSWDVMNAWDELALGTLNRRETFTIDPAQSTYRLLREDLDPTDGSWNTVLESTVTANPPKIDATIKGSDPSDPDKTGVCTDTQAKALQDAADDVCNSMDCLGKYDPALQARMKKTFAVRDLQLKCAKVGTPEKPSCGNSDNLDTTCLGPSCSDPVQISIDPRVFIAGLKGCGTLQSTLFHEMLHYVFGGHPIEDGQEDPNDPVYGCEALCGRNPELPSSLSRCAACLQTTQGDMRCAGYFPPPPCDKDPESGYCDCDSASTKSFPDYTACTVSCPSGIGCFAAGCWRVSPPPKCTVSGAPCGCIPCCGGACTDGKCP
jgi:hypothetical protein